MSAYSEWKCGAITDDEYKSAAIRECMDSDPFDRYTCHDCSSYKDCCEQVTHLGYPQCEEGFEKFDDEYEVYEAMQENDFMQTIYGCTDSESILRDYSLVDIQEDYKTWKKSKQENKQ